MYIGESIEAMPMPVPPMIRATTRCHGAVGMAEPIEQSTNSTAARSMIFLRPKRSAKTPAIAAPIRQPTSAELTIQPSISVGQLELLCHGPFGPGDHGRVEAEQQTAERGHQTRQRKIRETPSVVLMHRVSLPPMLLAPTQPSLHYPLDSRLLVGRVEHGDDVLRRHVGQDVVDLLKDETAAGREDRNLPADVLADFVGRAVREDEAGVAAAAPKREPVAEIALQPGRVHAGASDLHRD